MNEFRSMRAKCLDMDSNADVVLHEVSYEIKDSEVWIAKTTQLMATDPQDAIESVRKHGG
jgi:hypothetical protein